MITLSITLYFWICLSHVTIKCQLQKPEIECDEFLSKSGGSKTEEESIVIWDLCTNG
jgi:hypothetical protein